MRNWMRNWSFFLYNVALLTLAISLFLVLGTNNWINNRRHLAHVSASVSETKATVASVATKATPPRVEAETPKRKVALYTVVKGDTLSGACGSSWRKVADMNDLAAPYTIRVGQRLLVPEGVQCKEKGQEGFPHS